MKLKNHFICIIVFIAISIIFIPEEKTTYSNLVLENIEVLASGESGGIKCATDYNGPYCGEYTNSSGYRVCVYYP